MKAGMSSSQSISGLKKVLYLYDNYPAYRTEFFAQLNETLQRDGLAFELFYGRKLKADSKQSDETPFPAESFLVKEVNLGGVEYKRFLHFKRAFRQAKPDVVVLQFHVSVLTYWWAYFYMRRHHIPYIIWECNYTRDTLGSLSVKFRRKLVDYTFRHAAACISYGSVFRDYLLKLGISPDKVIVAQNTINVQKIIDNRSSGFGPRRFNHPLRVLYVGALIDRKYVDSSITAVANLIRDGYDVYYDIVGDGAEYGKLKGMIDDLGVGERITLHGAKHGAEAQAFFEQDDLFLLPGTGGLAINEAMAYALPIISTVGDDTVVDLIDGNGYLLEHFGNASEIESALKSFINLKEEEKMEMSRKSETLVKERASFDNMIAQHGKAIRYVIG